MRPKRLSQSAGYLATLVLLSSCGEPLEYPPPSALEKPERVLRHAVFFQFNEDAGDEGAKQVIDAFRELPKKIDVIKGFEWGVNNSPEPFSDGYTHCFLLTFKDEAGRKVYLPHPEHKAFGKVLGPHLEPGKVFVIDYWAEPEKKPAKKALRHAVFFRFKKEVTAREVKAIEEAFAALPSKIDAIKAFERGKNNSPEGKDEGFTHCFLVTFDSEEGRKTYLEHPEHQAFVKLLQPVLDKPRVLDFWAQK